MRAGNVLCYGDNLEILRRHIDDESVSLVKLASLFDNRRGSLLSVRSQCDTTPADPLR